MPIGEIPLGEVPITIPTNNVAAFVRQLAERHDVTYVETAADKIAHVVTRLSGDDIEVDGIEDLVVALCRRGVITTRQSLELIGTHVRERREADEEVDMDAPAISISRQATIALDVDGVLLDYSRAYADAWAKAFGERPAVRDPEAYWPIDRWAVDRLQGERLGAFRAAFDEQFWSTIPAIAGAIDACQRLVDVGYRLVCVSAVEAAFAAARRRNLESLGFPIAEVIATSSDASQASPKAAALAKLQAVAFVDDYLPYHRGVMPPVHKALILREPNGSPNTGAELANVDSQHANLAAFTDWWLTTRVNTVKSELIAPVR